MVICDGLVLIQSWWFVFIQMPFMNVTLNYDNRKTGLSLIKKKSFVIVCGFMVVCHNLWWFVVV